MIKESCGWKELGLRRVAIGAAAAALSLLVPAGCGSSSRTAIASSSTQTGGPLRQAGALHISGSDGRTIVVGFRLGPLLYSDEGTPPKSALKACGAESPEVLRQMVFSKGVMTATFTKGRSITDYRLAPLEFVSGNPWHGRTAIWGGGSWQCSESFETVLKRKQPQVFPFWVLSQGLGPGQSRMPRADLDTWRFTEFPVLPDSAFRATGPGAAACSVAGHSEQRLALYARAPFKSVGPGDRRMTCRPPGS